MQYGMQFGMQYGMQQDPAMQQQYVQYDPSTAAAVRYAIKVLQRLLQFHWQPRSFLSACTAWCWPPACSTRAGSEFFSVSLIAFFFYFGFFFPF
jgi:hypothetical protein